MYMFYFTIQSPNSFFINAHHFSLSLSCAIAQFSAVSGHFSEIQRTTYDFALEDSKKNLSHGRTKSKIIPTS
jgi:hypothetical protein